MITELKYSNTNTYLIQGKSGSLLFDTGWAGTFPMLCRALGEKKLRLQDIDYLLISHFHPDHMGIAQEVANAGVTIAAADLQEGYLHSCDGVFAKEKRTGFIPIDDGRVRLFTVAQSRDFLKELGIEGEVIHTPGHSDDSISLWLDRERALFVGDLNPLYELDAHRGTQIAQVWEELLRRDPSVVYYGHAKAAQLGGRDRGRQKAPDGDIYALVKKITKLVDKGCTTEVIEKKTGADRAFISDVARMYVTHPNVSVQGILDRIEIKEK